MRRKAIRQVLAIVVVAGTLMTGAGRAQAWYSPVNVWRQSAPPAPPGLLGETTCLIQSMDGNIFGTAFAKAYAVSGSCLTLKSVVVYGSLGLSGTPGAVVGCCNVVTQSSQAGSGVVGGFFTVTASDHLAPIVVVTTVFAPAVALQTASAQSSTLSVDGSTATSLTTLTSLMDRAFDRVMAMARHDAPRPFYAPDVRAALIVTYDAYRDCMVAHGIADYPPLPDGFGDGTVPDPVMGGPSTSDLNGDSPDLQQAVAACAAENAVLRATTLAANHHGGI